MKKGNAIAIVMALCVGGNGLNAQDPEIMNINNRPIKKSEFEAVYRKNNGKEATANTSPFRSRARRLAASKSR